MGEDRATDSAAPQKDSGVFMCVYGPGDDLCRQIEGVCKAQNAVKERLKTEKRIIKWRNTAFKKRQECMKESRE